MKKIEVFKKENPDEVLASSMTGKMQVLSSLTNAKKMMT